MKSIEAQLNELGRVKDCQCVMPTMREIEDVAYELWRERAASIGGASRLVDIFNSADMYEKCLKIVEDWVREVSDGSRRYIANCLLLGMRSTTVRTPTVEITFVDADCMGRLNPGTLAAIAMRDLVREVDGYSMMCPKAHFVWRNCTPNTDFIDEIRDSAARRARIWKQLDKQ